MKTANADTEHTPPSDYHGLDPEKILVTLQVTTKRIESVFPGSGLGRVSQRLVSTAQEATADARWLEQPIIWLRLAIVLLIAVMVAGLAALVITFEVPASGFDFGELVQVLEAGLNEVVLLGIGVFFLTTLEARIKRRRALRGLHKLRAIAHIIDMHQLSKDPQFLGIPTEVAEGAVTAETSVQLMRYLDFCTDLLALVGKVAVLYVQNFDEPVTLASVNEIESVTSGLARKIWQKLMVVHMKGAG